MRSHTIFIEAVSTRFIDISTRRLFKGNTMQLSNYEYQYQQEQFERMTGAGSDYPSEITPLGFVCEYSFCDQAILLPALAENFGESFYNEVMRLRTLSIDAIALLIESEPLWQQLYTESV